MNKLEISFGSPLVLVHQVGQSVQKELQGIFTIEFGEFKVKGENMASTLPAGGRAVLSVKWIDSAGNIVPVDNPTVWASSFPEIVQVTVATGNPLIANLFAPGPPGLAQIQATADADLGDGVKNVTATLDINVIAGQAVGGEIDFQLT